MKYSLIIFLLGSLFSSSTFAVNLNTDALKKMQKQGTQIATTAKTLATYRAVNGMCLTATGNVSKPGTRLSIRKCNNKVQQKWKISAKKEFIGGGLLCLNVIGSVKYPGSSVNIARCNKTIKQKWSLTAAKQLKNNGGLCLNIEGAINAPNRPLLMRKCTKSKNQQWVKK